ncbi:MAG TPA: alpha/beta hydrolase [Syntrophales bacterium]|nr:alpha/beta hydrolase [Syntrophales bacterium]HOX94056.1 alpha/beta hydrolase [Syntrophales bacterium]HPI58086.1 alpha/beta hydrolase [Syntrophales bacterium]HPN24621.1 alpha/beta hydrolase [Syntrophales bacterium]HQM28926.1 alpha/beta hydrolase [Syntrophales bacterium]
MPFLDVPGLKIHYEIGGSGKKVLVLLHGNFGSWRWWQPVLKRLPENCRAYAPDLRGCGETGRPGVGHSVEQLASDLYAFSRGLGLPAFHLVGHSLGGAVAMQFALDHPEMVRSMLLVAPAPAEGMKGKVEGLAWLIDVFKLDGADEQKEHQDEKQPALLAGIPGPPDYRSPDGLAAVYGRLQKLGILRRCLRRALVRMAPYARQDEYFETLVDDAVRMSPEAVVGHLSSLLTWNVQGELSRLRMPVLILRGAEDSLVPLDALERTVGGLKRGELVTREKVGHSPLIEDPDFLVEILTGHIAESTAWWNFSEKLLPVRRRIARMLG